jgi:UDP-glucuronate decarboxylase
MTKRILITGGAGFLGSHLCERLLQGDNEILCLDNFYTGTRNNITDFIGNSRFELIRHDIINPIYLEVDEIYNLACPASPVHYQFNPIKTIKTNIMGAINVLGIAKRTKAKILQASTSEIYGDPEIHPQNESYWGRVNPIGIRSCYDEGKRAAECLMMDYRRQNSVNTKIVRIFNTYGPRMAINDGRVVSNFIIQALQGKDITIYGDGSHTRSFCYIDDMIDGLIKMMNSGDDFYGPVNLGNPGEFTILELAQMIIKLTKSNSRIIYRPLPADDPVQRKPDITLAQTKLKWNPKIELVKGLTGTIKYFRDVLQIIL